MLRKIYIFNAILVVAFLLTTIFPSSLLSYETKGDKRIDESMGYKEMVYKKVRCPRCGMEFYYMPGKESPHSHWVDYEIPEDGDYEEETDLSNNNKETKGIFDALEKKKEALDKKEKEIDRKMTLMDKGMSSPGLTEIRPKRYELRQKLTCPYDGYSFFPEGDIIEDRKLMEAELMPNEEPSPIEASFSKTIAFGASRELKQFGYDLFIGAKEEEKEEEKTDVIGKSGEALSAIGMLETVLNPKAGGQPSFSTKSLSQTAVIPVDPDYIIGPGDTLIINIWGSVQESFPVEVDREGKIMLPKAGPLYIWGLKFKEAENRIKDRLNRFYTNFNVDVSMGKLRQVQVYVMGEVNKPGSYAVESQSMIFKALFAAGGPTKLGSLRKIKVIEPDGKERIVDLYPFLLTGEKTESSRIQSGDTIFVPPIGDVVAITGNVKRPGIYETRSEIPLKELLGFAGGVTPTGDLQRIQVERITNNERRVMLDIELKPEDMKKLSLENINMQNGDMVIVSPIVRLKHDFVSIIGNIERPGDYALSKDMKVSELLKRAKGFMPATYLRRAEIARVTRNRTREIIPVNLDNILLGAEDEDIFLNEWDILLVYAESEVTPPSFVEVDGAVNRPGRYELSSSMKVSDLIFKAGGIKPGLVIKGAELFHIMPEEQPVVREIGLNRVSDIEVLVDKDIILRAGDALFVKSEPKLTERKVVVIKGEVRYPGTYSIREGEKISSLIERAGGFTKDAFLDGTVFSRKSIKEAQEKMREHFIARENKALLEEQQSMLLRRGAAAEAANITESVNMRHEMLSYIASAEIEGRMVVKIMDISHQLNNSKYDILLEDGDVISIPTTPSIITVMGSVNSPASIPFEAGKGLQYYIRKTGGLTKHADKNGIYVIKANGEAVSKFMMSKRINRGDTIVVPQEFKYWTPPGQLLRDTVEILSRIAVGVGIIAALD